MSLSWGNCAQADNAKLHSIATITAAVFLYKLTVFVVEFIREMLVNIHPH